MSSSGRGDPGEPRSHEHWADMALVGRVARAHGLGGHVIVNPETDFPESRFQAGCVVYCEGGHRVDALRIATVRFHRGRPIIGFEGIDSVETAEQMAGKELRVPVGSLARLPAGSFYHHDLAGCRVETRSGEVVGEVEHVEGDGGASRLAVATGRGEVLVPLAADICVVVDIARKVIVIEPPAGLLELNASRDQGAGSRDRGSRIEADGARPKPSTAGRRGPEGPRARARRRRR